MYWNSIKQKRGIENEKFVEYYCLDYWNNLLHEIVKIYVIGGIEMNKSVGLNNVIKHLENERERFLRAGLSGMFCDSVSCLKTACTIEYAIDEINEVRKQLNI